VSERPASVVTVGATEPKKSRKPAGGVGPATAKKA
jgi:hypothetical protein